MNVFCGRQGIAICEQLDVTYSLNSRHGTHLNVRMLSTAWTGYLESKFHTDCAIYRLHRLFGSNALNCYQGPLFYSAIYLLRLL